MLLKYFIVFTLIEGYYGLNDFGWLPDETEPELYVLKVVPNLDSASGSFAGQVVITIRVKTTTPMITLNSKNLILHDVKIANKQTNMYVKVNYWNFVQRQEVKILTREPVLANQKYKIYIRFSGMLQRDDASGFSKSFYTSDSGKKMCLAAIIFKTTHDARSVFPCYDDPDFRTLFNISIKVKKNELVLSNMPVLNVVDEDKKLADAEKSMHQKKTWVHFQQTPPVPTSLVSLIIGEFENLEYDRKKLVNAYLGLSSSYQRGELNKDFYQRTLLKVMKKSNINQDESTASILTSELSETTSPSEKSSTSEQQVITTETNPQSPQSSMKTSSPSEQPETIYTNSQTPMETKTSTEKLEPTTPIYNQTSTVNSTTPEPPERTTSDSTEIPDNTTTSEPFESTSHSQLTTEHSPTSSDSMNQTESSTYSSTETVSIQTTHDSTTSYHHHQSFYLSDLLFYQPFNIAATLLVFLILFVFFVRRRGVGFF